jgi:YfiH family protein
MLIVRSALLHPFPHGFTTREGGVSPAPWDSLNLGGAVGDAPDRVEANWRRLEAETGLGFARVRQVHGVRVVRADAPGAPAEEADAVVSLRPGVAACVSVADCVPVLLADPATGAVAAVHAGWRGTLARAAAEGVRALAREAGAPPERLLAAVGPSIGPCCYEVSPELAERFRAGIGPVVREGTAPRLDLWSANRRVLEQAGLRPERIDLLGRCTACERDLFFSHRRDAGRTGRQMAFIAPPAPTSPAAPLP